jgi:hypothetical protein
METDSSHQNVVFWIKIRTTDNVQKETCHSDLFCAVWMTSTSFHCILQSSVEQLCHSGLQTHSKLEQRHAGILSLVVLSRNGLALTCSTLHHHSCHGHGRWSRMIGSTWIWMMEPGVQHHCCYSRSWCLMMLRPRRGNTCWKHMMMWWILVMM